MSPSEPPTDRVKQAESEDPDIEYPEERWYTDVEILDSGWVKCVERRETRDEDHEGQAVDYYPPELVNGIFSVE